MKKNKKTVSARPASTRRAVTFTVETAPGREVMISGSFNDWRTDRRMEDKKGAGVYTCRLLLEPGEYQYKFIIDGEWRLDDANPNFTPNEFGSLNSLLIVEAAK